MSKTQQQQHQNHRYGVIAKTSLLQPVHLGPSSRFKLEPRTVIEGQMVIVDNKPVTTLPYEQYSVRVRRECDEWERDRYLIDTDQVFLVPERLWQYIFAVDSPRERIKLARNRERCEKLLQVKLENTVSYTLEKTVLLGVVRFMGNAKGHGFCIGLEMHEKRPRSVETGTIGGITFFKCKPGHALFAKIDKILPYYSSPDNKTPASQVNELSSPLNEVVNNILFNSQNSQFIEPMKKTSLGAGSTIGSPSLRSSVKFHGDTINSTNDFDLNTVLQPERVPLVPPQKNTLSALSSIRESNNGSAMSSLSVELRRKHDGEVAPKSVTKPTSNGVSATSIRHYSHVPPTSSTRSKSLNPLTHLISATIPRSRPFPERPSFKSYESELSDERQPYPNERHPPPNQQPPPTSPPQPTVKFVSPNVAVTGDLTVGSLVQIVRKIDGATLYGVVRWLGVDQLIEQRPVLYTNNDVMVGVELEDVLDCAGDQLDSGLDGPNAIWTISDGEYRGVRCFHSDDHRALFVPLAQCQRDIRFDDEPKSSSNGGGVHYNNISVSSYSGDHVNNERKFGKEVNMPVIEGLVEPFMLCGDRDVAAICGSSRGIQGHHNSCYLDATLFSMFAFTTVFDGLLYRPRCDDDIPEYDEVQRVLREEIVNPLRSNMFVRADRVMKLREQLDRLSSVQGLTSEEKDPEEFLNSLLAQILRAEPFLKLNSGQESYHHQLFLEKDEQLKLPTVQQLFDQSFLQSNIKLREVPSCLIIQMPRFGKNYKMFPRILPSQLLDVTDVIEYSPRSCTVCGSLADFECVQCYYEFKCTAFCGPCLQKTHQHHERQSHAPRPLGISEDYMAYSSLNRSPPRLFMELFAVVCIETSHYVTFVKCGTGHEAPWCFFDSMADRKGEKDGYNIPKVVACPDVAKWLSDEVACERLDADAPLDRHLPEHARRLLCDAYICMYQSPDVMMYR